MAGINVTIDNKLKNFVLYKIDFEQRYVVDDARMFVYFYQINPANNVKENSVQLIFQNGKTAYEGLRIQGLRYFYLELCSYLGVNNNVVPNDMEGELIG